MPVLRSAVLLFTAGVLATPLLALGVPRGTLVQVRIEEDLRSDEVRVGDPFHGTVLETVSVAGRPAIQSGSTVQGLVTLVRSRAHGDRSGAIGLRFVRLHTLDGREYPLDGTLVGFRSHLDAAEAAPAPASAKRAVVVIGSEADGPGKRPSSLVGNVGEDEKALAARWADSGLGPSQADIDAGSEMTFELRRGLDVEPPHEQPDR